MYVGFTVYGLGSLGFGVKGPIPCRDLDFRVRSDSDTNVSTTCIHAPDPPYKSARKSYTTEHMHNIKCCFQHDKDEKPV